MKIMQRDQSATKNSVIRKKCNMKNVTRVKHGKNSISEFLDSGRKSWMLDSGCWTLDSDLQTLDPRRWTLDAKLWTLNPGP